MYANYIWAKVIGYLEAHLSDEAVSTWLEDAEVVSLTEDRLILYSPSERRQQAIRKHCAQRIRQAMAELFHQDIQLEVWGDRQLQNHREQGKADHCLHLNHRYYFENFVIGPSNALAAKMARSVAEAPGGQACAPLLLYGPSGVGKTHLLYAIAYELRTRFPEKKVILLKADQFTGELIWALTSDQMGAFKERYRQADVLLVDDIQFLAGKSTTQREFYHIFNDLYEHKRQIVITADNRPEEMATLEERLKKRFGSGILVGIAPPERETRLAIIRIKAAAMNLALPAESVNDLADRLTDNVRQIEGALNRLRAFHELTDMALTPENINATLEDILPNIKNSKN